MAELGVSKKMHKVEEFGKVSIGRKTQKNITKIKERRLRSQPRGHSVIQEVSVDISSQQTSGPSGINRSSSDVLVEFVRHASMENRKGIVALHVAGECGDDVVTEGDHILHIVGGTTRPKYFHVRNVGVTETEDLLERILRAVARSSQNGHSLTRNTRCSDGNNRSDAVARSLRTGNHTRRSNRFDLDPLVATVGGIDLY